QRSGEKEGRTIMRRNCSLLVLVLVTAFALLRAPTTFGQDAVLRICDGRSVCTYNGFSQSSGNPNIRGPAALDVSPQTSDGDFQGLITLLGTTYSIRGKVDASGNLKFTSGRAGGITGHGKWHDLTRGGARIFGSYKLASGDQGQVSFLRNFT